ncbi:MAG: bifunctional (p)ppGpp synthetase/guanosine-3',5'-bis(diphosphate) 3'-pyrophosphohydrolase [Clostridia bacterium]|nr:bifunctional (p)ppGpp synthetase/guanosine-3',5'-bis(diphosphate) 3'-pyrophosphohydrolase [Clostridia bacterium]
MTINDFIKIVNENYGEQGEKIINALDLAIENNTNEKDINGEPFINHIIKTANMLISYNLDAETIICCLLHDAVSRGDLNIKEVKSFFGDEVEALVKGCNKISHIKYKRDGAQDVELENFRQMFIALGKDLRVILIIICNRYQTLEVLESLPVEKQKELARETMDIYVPLIERLGIGKIKSHMEDICFKVLCPKEYQELKDELERKFKKKTQIMQEVNQKLEGILEKLKINGTVSSRFKHFYSVYKKLSKGGVDKIYDIIALRVIVDDVKDCYSVLGEIHAQYKPVPGRFKDYIASPKPNGYRSLHTTLLTTDGVPFEVQIRTEEMHKFCEYGIAAHWRYKEGNNKQSVLDEKINEFKKIIESERAIKDDEKFVDALKMDLGTGTIWVFTPKRKPVELPEQATPIDFAYAIHTSVGNKCVGAVVNGKMVPLSYNLQTGDVVEILTNPASKGPSLDWLNFARSSSTRNRIRNYFRQQSKDENIKLGREILDLEAKKCGYALNDLLGDLDMEELKKRFNLLSVDDVFASIGYGGITAKQALGKVVAERKTKEKLERKIRQSQIESAKKLDNSNGVIVDGMTGVPVRFGKCCNPIVGDKIVAFASRGRGITIHRADCPNACLIDNAKQVGVEWGQSGSQLFNISLTVIAKNDGMAISNITNALTSIKVNIVSIVNTTTRDGEAKIDLVVQVKDRQQEKGIKVKLKSLSDVYDVK